MARVTPPEYAITGKKGVWYLERTIEDRWEPFPSLDTAELTAWMGWIDTHAGTIRKLHEYAVRWPKIKRHGRFGHWEAAPPESTKGDQWVYNALGRAVMEYRTQVLQPLRDKGVL